MLKQQDDVALLTALVFLLLSSLAFSVSDVSSIRAENCQECKTTISNDGKSAAVSCADASGEGKTTCKIVKKTDDLTGELTIVCKLSGDDCTGDAIEMF